MGPYEFGQYLKMLRKAKGITLAKVGDVTQNTVAHLSNIENGHRGMPSPQMVRKLAAALCVTHIGLMIKAGHVTEEEVLIYRKEHGVDDLRGGEQSE